MQQEKSPRKHKESRRVSVAPLAEWMFILQGGLEKANAVLADLIPGSHGFKALHLDHAIQRYSLHLNPVQTQELQARVGMDPDTKLMLTQVQSPASC